MTKINTNNLREQYNDQFEVDLNNYVRESLKILKSKGLNPLQCVQTITPNWTSDGCGNVSWLMAEHIVFVELKNKINEVTFDNDFSFINGKGRI